MSGPLTLGRTTHWYGPDPKQGTRDVAAEAYHNAIKHLRGELGVHGDAPIPPENYASIDDIYAAVETTKKLYLGSSDRNSRVRKGLEDLSTRIMYYGKVFDTLAQHHPEYVALAWGSLKFVLMGIINHATLVEKLSQAIVAIGDVLPRAQLSAGMYQTDYMSAALSRLYAHVLLFFQLCVKWFNKSPLGRLWSSVKTPFELRYQEVLEQIQLCSKSVEELSDAGARAEIRDIRLLLKEHQSKSLERDEKLFEMQLKFESYICQVLQIGTEHKSITERISVEVGEIGKCVSRTERHHIIQFFAPTVSPNDALAKSNSFLRRSVELTMPPVADINIQDIITTWACTETSSLLVLQISPQAETRAKEITNNVIDLLQKNKQCVLWNISLGALNSLSANKTNSISQVLKAIIFQTLQQLGPESNQFMEQINLDKINAAHSETEWADLISLLLTKLPRCYIVVDTEDLQRAHQQDQGWTQRLTSLLETIMEKGTASGSLVKILLLMMEPKDRKALVSSKNKRVSAVSLRAPILLPPHRRHMAQRTGLNATKWKFPKPKI